MAHQLHHYKIIRGGTKQDGLKKMVRLVDYWGKLTKISKDAGFVYESLRIETNRVI